MEKLSSEKLWLWKEWKKNIVNLSDSIALTINNLLLQKNSIKRDIPTVIRFNRYQNDENIIYNIENALWYEVNVINIPYKFKNLDNVYEEIILLLNQMEILYNINIVWIELPFSDSVKLSEIYNKIKIGWWELLILQPIFNDEEDKKTKKNNYEKKRKVVDYKIFDKLYYFDIESEDIDNINVVKKNNPCVLRYTRHNLSDNAKNNLKDVFWEDLLIIDYIDKYPYNLNSILNDVKSDVEEQERKWNNIVAIELILPSYIKTWIINDDFFINKWIFIINPIFKKEKDNISYVNWNEDEMFEFERYDYLNIYPIFLDLLEPINIWKNIKNNKNNKFKLRQEESEKDNKLKDLYLLLNNVLTMMGDEKWEKAFNYIMNSNLKNILEQLNININIIEKEYNTSFEFKEFLSKYEEYKKLLIFEKFVLSTECKSELEKKNINTWNIIKKLTILNLFSIVEELLHVIQKNSSNKLLSKEWLMLFSNPYFNEESFIKNRNLLLLDISNDKEDLKSFLAYEYDIFCIYKNFWIKIPPLVLHSYQRLDIISLVLGKDFNLIYLKWLEEKIKWLKINEELIIDDNIIRKYDKNNLVFWINKWIHWIIKRMKNWYKISYPKNNWSKWGIFHENNEWYWKEIWNEFEVKSNQSINIKIWPWVKITLS